MAIVRDFMNRDFTVLHGEMTLQEATKVLLENSLSGAAVIDEQGNLSGFITERDIINRIKENFASSGLPLHLSLFDAVFLYDPKSTDRNKFENEAKKVAEIPVKEVMWKKVITVKPEDNLEIALHYLSKYRINRIPVVEKNRIVGILSRKDVLDSIFRIMQKEEPD